MALDLGLPAAAARRLQAGELEQSGRRRLEALGDRACDLVERAARAASSRACEPARVLARAPTGPRAPRARRGRLRRARSRRRPARRRRRGAWPPRLDLGQQRAGAASGRYPALRAAPAARSAAALEALAEHLELAPARARRARSRPDLGGDRVAAAAAHLRLADQSLQSARAPRRLLPRRSATRAALPAAALEIRRGRELRERMLRVRDRRSAPRPRCRRAWRQAFLQRRAARAELGLAGARRAARRSRRRRGLRGAARAASTACAFVLRRGAHRCLRGLGLGRRFASACARPRRLRLRARRAGSSRRAGARRRTARRRRS